MAGENIPPTQQLLTKNPNTPVIYADIFPAIRYLLEIGGTGTGDFVGPASSTDNAVVRFDGVTGKLGQNSVMTVSDAGVVNIPAGQTYNINGVPIGTGGLLADGTVTGAAAQSQAFTNGINVIGGGNTTQITNSQIITGSAAGTASMASDGTFYSTDNGGGAEKRTEIQFDETVVTDNGVQKVKIDTTGIRVEDGINLARIRDDGTGTFNDGTDTLTVSATSFTGTAAGISFEANAGRVMFGNIGAATTTKVFADSPYTILDQDFSVLCNATGGAIVINLPAAASWIGRLLNIKKIDASVNTVTIVADGAETIDGSATNVITAQWTNIQIQCGAGNWYVL